MAVFVVILQWFHKLLIVLYRHTFIFFYGKRGASMPRIQNTILLESASSLATKIRQQHLTSVQVMKSFIDRIKEVDPSLNCVIDKRFEDAISDAEAADKSIGSGEFSEEELAREKPFLGVPFSTKGTFSVKGFRWTSALHSRKDIDSEYDAEAIALIRKSGAIPFVSTNAPELCIWWETHNDMFGRTKNAYDTNRTSGGSSGGEGSLIAAGGSPFGIASDVAGSIRIPAFFNGIFGHKPSKFIVSADGHYPNPSNIEQSAYFCVGPMSRYATDLKPLLRVMAKDNAELLNLDQPVDLKKIRFFYQFNDGGGLFISEVDNDIQEALKKVVNHLLSTVKADATQVAIPLQNTARTFFATAHIHNDIPLGVRLTNNNGDIYLWWELLKCIFRQSKHTFYTLSAIMIERLLKLFMKKYHKRTILENAELRQMFSDMLGSDGVFLYPTHPTVAPYHNESYVRALNVAYTVMFSVLGLPVTAIPLGLGSEGLPVGIQAVAGLNQDRLTLAVACELERAFGGWVAPEGSVV